VSFGEKCSTFRRIVKPSHIRAKQYSLIGLLVAEDEGATNLRNVGNHSPNVTASHP
jgi:hypothetical protein